MSDTWAGVLAISVAVMALVQVSVLIGLAVVARRFAETSKHVMASADSTRRQVEALAADV